MADTIFFDGVKYVSAGDAAKQVFVSRDYIAHLCKQNKILGRKIGKQWYVSQDSVESYILLQNSERERRRKELAEVRSLEYRIKNTQPGPVNVAPNRGDWHLPSALRARVAGMPVHSAAQVARVLTGAPIQAVSLAKHGSMHAVAPLMDAVHKILAGAIAVLFLIGTYALVDAQYAHIAQSMQGAANSSREYLNDQLAAASENPTGAFSGILAALARAFNKSVDSFVFGTMFPNGTSSNLTTNASARVLLTTDMLAAFRGESQQTLGGGSGAIAQTGRTQPTIIERVVETQRVISSAGGITEAYLNARLQELDSKFSSQLFSVSSQSSANTTQISNNFAAVAGASRLERLDDIDIDNSDFTNGRISSSSVSATALSVTGTGTSTFAGGIQATALNITSTSATSTFALGIDLEDGCFAVDGVCITGSGGTSASSTLLADKNTWTALQLFSANASTTNFSNFGTAYFGGTATSSFSSAGALTLATALATSSGGTGISSYAVGDLLAVNASGILARLGIGSSGQVLKVSGGVPTWGADLQGSGGGSSAWATTSDDLLIYPIDPTDVLVLGASATSTTGNIFEVLGNSLFRGLLTAYNTITAPTFTATSTTAASTFPYASTTAITISGNSYFTSLASALLGVDTTGKLVATSSIGTNLLTGPLGTINGTSLSAGGSATITAASSTLLANNNTFSGNNIFTGSNLILASTTIGGGTQTTGLTVTGGATTTGYLVVQGTSASSTFASGLQATALNITGTSATSTFANGINLSGGCFSINGSCVGGGGGSGTVTSITAGTGLSGGTITTSGTVSLNLANANTWTALQLFSANASTTNFSNFGTAYFGGTATSSFSSAGALTLATALATSSGGTGISSYAVGDLLAVNASGILARLGIGSTGQVLKVAGGVPTWGADATGGGGGGSSAFATSSDDLLIYPTDPTDVLVLGASATTTTGNIFEVLGNSLFRGTVTAYNTITAPKFTATSTTAASTFPYASTTAITISGNSYFTSLASALLGVDTTGKLVATSSIGTNLLTGPLGTINGTSLSAGGSATITAASSTLLSNNNTFSGSNIFSSTITGSVSGNAGTATALQTARNINGTSFDGTANITVTAASSTLLANNNTFTGLNTFGNATSTLLSIFDRLYIGNTSGTAATSTLQSNTTGTSTIQGFLNVAGTNSTSTFSGALASTYLNVTGTSATSTFANGVNFTGGCVSINGTCLGTSNVTNLDSLTDTVITSAAYGKLLMYDGSNWVDTATSSLFSTSQHFSQWLSDETGTGSVVFSASPTLTGTPVLSGFISNASSTITSGLFSMNGGASSTAITNSGNTWLTSITNALLGTDNNGKVVATSSIGTNLLTGPLGTINGTSLSAGGSATITAASSTLLSNNNTFSGSNAFSSALTLSGTTGTTTIASGQGFTIGSSQFVLQQGSGNVGIGTAAPINVLDVKTATNIHFGIQSGIVDNTAVTFNAYNDGGGSNIPLEFRASKFDFTIGKVGIGVASPSGQLDVRASTVLPGSGWGQLSLISSDALAADKGGVINFGGIYTGTTAAEWAGIAGLKTNATDGNLSGYLAFYTRNNGSATAERMRIDNVGNVGIGTTTPSHALTIAAGSAPQLSLVDTTNTSNAWTLRSISNSLYLATSTYSATSSVAALAFNASSGAATFGSPATTTFTGGIQSTYLNITGTSATSTLAGGVYITGGGLRIGTLTSCNTIDTDSNGNFICGTDATGGGGSDPFTHPTTASSATTSLMLFNGSASTTLFSAYGPAYFGATATSSFSAAGVLTLASTFAANGTSGTSTIASGQGFTIGGSQFVLQQGSGNVGIGTTTVGQLLALNVPSGGTKAGGQADATNAARTFEWGIRAEGDAADEERSAIQFRTAVGSGGSDSEIGFWTNQYNASRAERMTINKLGNVGIGTTSPATALEVFTNASANARGASFVQYGDITGASQLNLFKARGTSASPSAVLSGDNLGSILFRGYDGTNSWGSTVANASIGASVVANVAENWSSSAHGTNLVFNTTAIGASALTERMRVTSDGNVGIGTTTPWRRLSIVDGTASTPQVAVSYDNTNASQMMVDSTGALAIVASGNQIRLNNDNFWVCTGGSATTNGCPTGNPSGQGNLVIENRLGIGTSTLGVSGANYAFTLDLQNDSSTNLVSISTSTSGYGTTRSLFTINSGGKVGIATSSPVTRLAIGAGGAITTTENSLTDGATVAVDWTEGNQQKVTLGGNRTITFANYIAGQTLRLILCQDATGSRTITWPAAVLWPSGTAPTLTTTANRCDVLTFLATNATSTLKIFGSSVLAF